MSPGLPANGDNTNCRQCGSYVELEEKSIIAVNNRIRMHRIRGGLTAGPPAWPPAFGVHDDAIALSALYKITNYKSTLDSLYFTTFFHLLASIPEF